MSLCETIAALTDSVRKVYDPLPPREALIANILCAAPVYRNAKLLNLWAGAYQDVTYDVAQSTVQQLFAGIFELANCCLYAAYREERVREEYVKLKDKLFQAGVFELDYPDLSGW